VEVRVNYGAGGCEEGVLIGGQKTTCYVLQGKVSINVPERSG
jgi:hypothetical protein